MKKTISYLLLLSAFGYLIAMMGLFTFQRSLTFKPDTTAPNLAAYAAEDVAQIVTTTTSDGLQINGWLFEADHPKKPIVIYFNGNSGHHGSRTKDAKDFIANGYTILLAGYRGYGGNPDSPSEQGLYKDARSWVHWMTARFPGRPVVLYGISLGSGVASKMAAEFDAAALVLEVPFTSVTNVAAGNYPYFPVHWLSLDRFDTLSRIKDITEPVLIMGAGQDTVVPPQHSLTLFENANEPKRLYFEPKANHSNMYKFDAPRQVLDFLDSLDITHP